MINIPDYSIAGINYRQGIEDYVGKFNGYLKPEPTNVYDPYAIAVYAHDGQHLGYIPATCTGEVHSFHKQFPLPIYIIIDEDYDELENRRFFRGSIYLTNKDKNI